MSTEIKIKKNIQNSSQNLSFDAILTSNGSPTNDATVLVAIGTVGSLYSNQAKPALAREECMF